MGAAARLGVERVGSWSVVSAAFARSPLRLLTPRNHGHAAWAYTSSLGGGFVDGDRVQLEVRVGPGAAAVVGTQGATRVYRSARGCGNTLRAEVGDGALLALLPDPTVCFKGARYDQRTEVHLAEGGALVLFEAIAAGRSGERWAFDAYASRLHVTCGAKTLVDERLVLDPLHGSLAGRFGRFEAIATLLLVGPGLPRDEIAARIAAEPVRRRAPLVQSASPLGTEALLVRIAATQVEDAVLAARAQLRFLPALLGDDPFSRRS